MPNIKNFYLPIIFFTCITIVSCFTFDSRNFKNYTYNAEMYAENIDFFGNATIFASSKVKNNKNDLLLLFNNNKLVSVISNDLRHNIKYTVAKNNNEETILTRETEAMKFTRMGSGTSDSIYFNGNLAIHKSGFFTNRTIRNNDYSRNIKVYEVEGNLVKIYNYKNKIEETKFSCKNIFDLFKINNKDSSFIYVERNLSYKKEEFFRKVIMGL